MFIRLLPRYGLDLSASNTVADKAISYGENAINSFDPKQTAGAQKTALGSSGLGALIDPQTNDFINEYTAAVKKNPTVTQLYNQGNENFNVPYLNTQATNLENRLTDVTPEAYKAASGFDIDATDINNGIANASSYLGPQAGRARANANTASGLAQNFVLAGQAQNMQNLLPIQAKAPLVAQQEAAQQTGWNQASHDEFQGLIDKMNAGVTLSAAELTRANTLASVEGAYQNALVAATAAQNVARINNQFQNVPYSNRLINTMTGNIIS